MKKSHTRDVKNDADGINVWHVQSISNALKTKQEQVFNMDFHN